MTEQSTSGRHLRAAPRHKLFEPTEMTATNGAARVHLLNLSTGGALAHAAEAPEPGTSLRIRCGDSLMLAKVAWRRGPRFGLCFAVPLAEAQLERMLDEQRVRITAAAHRVGSLA